VRAVSEHVVRIPGVREIAHWVRIFAQWKIAGIGKRVAMILVDPILYAVSAREDEDAV
jgi:hypothetical protein